MIVSCLLFEHTTHVRGVIRGVRLPGAIDLLAQPVEASLSAAPCDIQDEPVRSICTGDFGQTGSETTQHHGDCWAANFNNRLSNAFLLFVNDLDILQAGHFCNEGVKGRPEDRWRASWSRR